MTTLQAAARLPVWRVNKFCLHACMHFRHSELLSRRASFDVSRFVPPCLYIYTWPRDERDLDMNIFSLFLAYCRTYFIRWRLIWNQLLDIGCCFLNSLFDDYKRLAFVTIFEYTSWVTRTCNEKYCFTHPVTHCIYFASLTGLSWWIGKFPSVLLNFRSELS